MSVEHSQIRSQVAEAIKWPTSEEVKEYYNLIDKKQKEKEEKNIQYGDIFPSKKYLLDALEPKPLPEPLPPTITVQEAKQQADERVDNVYGYVINSLRALALVHEADAAKANIFDTERLTRLAKVKALRQGAALVETFREKAAQTFPEVSKAYPRIDELDPNKLFPIESEAKSGALMTTTGWTDPFVHGCGPKCPCHDPFSEQNS